MSYADLLEREGIEQQFLSVIKPRRKVTGFTLVSGSIYKISFDYGHVSGVAQNGTALTEHTSSALSAGQFYYDFDASELYVRTTDSSNPSTKFLVATYELYVGTFDAHIGRNPLDSTSRQVYYEPIISKAPTIKASLGSSLFGYLPVGSSQLTLTNVTHILEHHVYDSSFNQADVKIYHWLGKELDSNNIKLVYNGIIKSLDYSDRDISIKMVDRIDIFNKDYRNQVGASFFSLSDFPNLNPNAAGYPIRQVYGYVKGFVPVNIDYVIEGQTTSDNRDFVVINEDSNLGSVSTTVPASPASTTTRTYLTSAVGFQVGDSVWIDGATDYFVKVTAVGANFIDHAAIGAPANTGETVKRSFVGNVYIIQEQVVYEAMYGRDYDEATFAQNTAGFSFDTSLESNLSIPNTLSGNDVVFCNVYGHKNTVTLGGPAFGSNDSTLGNLAQGVVILFDLLKKSGLSESEINTASFTALQSSNTDRIGFAIPETSSGSFPSYKNIFTSSDSGGVLFTLLLRFLVDNDGKWKISQLGPSVSATKTIDDTEILEGSIGYDFDYSDIISDVFVEYLKQEKTTDANRTSEAVERVNAESENARFLHGVDKEKTFKSFHIFESEAQTLCNRLSYIFGERKGTLSISTKNRFFDTLINETHTVTRTALPGNEFDDETEFSRDVVVESTNKGLRQVQITFDDQLGIESNSGSW